MCQTTEPERYPPFEWNLNRMKSGAYNGCVYSSVCSLEANQLLSITAHKVVQMLIPALDTQPTRAHIAMSLQGAFSNLVASGVLFKLGSQYIVDIKALLDMMLSEDVEPVSKGPCHTCGGNGYLSGYGHGREDCPDCDGTGDETP